jgi:hypothetical protein
MGALAQVRVITNRYNQFTTGANTRETTLNSSNVNTSGFGKLCTYYVDGSVYAQPLYLPGVQIFRHGTHNVLYVATMNDKIYAFNADECGPPLWMRDLTDEMVGITPVPIDDITNNNDLNLVGNIGIESTPVIDLTENAIYLLARTKENGRYFQRLYKLDLQSGTDIARPAIIDASVNGSAPDAVAGIVHFDSKAGNQRPALALVGDKIVIAWASHEDLRPYHGWVMTYDARTLRQSGVLCITPDTGEGGIWQSGRGPTIDEAGNVYFEVGNGGWDGKRNFGSSAIKLSLQGSVIAFEDYFTPYDYQTLNSRDADFGSTGPLLVPGLNVLICGSKKGILYLLNPNSLGHMTPNDGGALQILPVNGGRVMAGPAYWEGPPGPTLFVWCETDFPKAYRFKGRLLEPDPYLKGKVASHGSPGGALTVSSDGAKAGTGILWATISQRSADHGNALGVLYAFNAETLEEVWNSEQNPKRDRLGTLVKFVPPLVVNGKVYVPNYDNAVNVYGILNAK